MDIEQRRQIARTFKGPKSLCLCGHTGDGPKSDHEDNLEHGHGRCKVDGCPCGQFTWKGWTLPFATAIR